MDSVIRSEFSTGVRRMPWRMVILAVLFLLLYAPLYPQLVGTWLDDSNNSHGILIPIVSLYLLWELRARIKAVDSVPSLAGLGLLAVSLISYFVCYVGGLVFPARITMITTLAGLILFNSGWAVFKVTLFPVLFLFFMVPVPDTLMNLVSFPLQLIVSDMSAHLIGLYGIPVYAEGNMLFFAQYSFEVTEACSGIRSLVSYLAIGTMLAYIQKDSWLTSLFLVLSTVPLALFVNFVRVSGTGILANYFGTKVAAGFAHDFSGFAVFCAGIVLMVAEAWLLKKIRFNRGASRKGVDL
jgi:exosortase